MKSLFSQLQSLLKRGLGLIALGTVLMLFSTASAQAAVTYTIDASGTGCSGAFSWDAGTKTCTLNQDLSVSGSAIKITGSSLPSEPFTLNGAGHTLTGDGSAGNYGVYAEDGAQQGLQVINFNINNFDEGISFLGAASGSILGNNITGCTNGIVLTQSANTNDVFYNTLKSSSKNGVWVLNSNSNSMYFNNFISNAAQAAVTGTSTGNFTSENYWDSWSTPPNCVPSNGGIYACAAPYSFTGGSDNMPLVLQDYFNRYDWSWYDNVGGDDWVLLGNRPLRDMHTPFTPFTPFTSSSGFFFNLNIANTQQSLPALAGGGPGYVDPGNIITTKYLDLKTGPVSAVASWPAAGSPIASQRILWPKGGNSLEEVPGTQGDALDSQFYWTWYDMQSSGFSDQILISDPNSFAVSYSIKIAGSVVQTGTIAAGDKVTPTFAGVMGGPVEVEANDGSGHRAVVMASQRVLSNNGSAFNELPGQPGSTLGSDYFWTWYDMQSTGANDWVLIANPNDPGGAQIYYKIFIAGNQVAQGGPIAPGGNVAPTFPGTMNGPVEVKTYSDPDFTTAANSIASQRSIFGPSFEEVPGCNYYRGCGYDWTWYDERSPGAQNWVLVANVSATDTITATVSFIDKTTGTLQSASRDLAPYGHWTPDFPGKMGGPVRVSAIDKTNPGLGAAIMASQRVLWNGYFNEVLGQ